jgi:hypothetical protein
MFLLLKSGLNLSGCTINSAVCLAKGMFVCPFISSNDLAEGLIVL